MFIGCIYLKTIDLAYIILTRKAKTLSCKFLPTKQPDHQLFSLSAQQIKGCSAAAVKMRIISNKCQGWDEAGRYKERGKASPAALWTVFAWNPVLTTVSLFHCFTVPLFRRGFGQRVYRLIFSPLPNFCSASLYLDISYRVKPQLLENNWGTYILYVQKCGLRVQKQVVKKSPNTGTTHGCKTGALN